MTALNAYSNRESALVSGDLLEECDQVAPFVWFGDVKFHVVAGDERVGIGEPVVERFLGPGDVGLPESVRVSEVGGRAGDASIDSGESGAFEVSIE